jgi:hypothetical protein
MARIGYYDVMGLPTAIWSGTDHQIGGATWVTDGLLYRAMILNDLASPSHFRITFNATDFTPPTGSVDLDVEVMEGGVDISTMVLRMSLNEDDVQEGSAIHQDVTRDMLDEVPITVDVLGQVQHVTASFDIDAGWDPDNLEIVAFLQDDADHAVHASASSQPRPDYSLRFYALGDRQVLGPSSGRHVFEPFRVYNSGNRADVYTVDLITELPAGWTASLCDDQICHGTTYSRSLAPGESLELHLEVEPASAGFASLSVQMSQGSLAHEFPRTVEYGYFTQGLDVLLVDDDGGERYEAYFADAIAHAGYSFGVWNRMIAPVSAGLLAEFPVVAWQVGRVFPTVDDNDRAALATYMDAGGSLLLTGQDIGKEIFDLGFPATRWYMDYLQAVLALDDTDDHTIDAVPGDPVSDGLDLVIEGGDGADNQHSPSAIDPGWPTATIIWKYDADRNAAVRVDTDAYRAIYLAFGFEAIDSAEDRRAVMRRSLDWLTGAATGVPSSGAPTVASLGCAPNPAGSVTTFRLRLPAADDVRLRVFGADGRHVCTIMDGPIAAGRHVARWDLTDDRGRHVPAGLYFFQLQGRGVRLTRKILVIR